MATVRFQLRRDTATNWASVNPTLGPGEPALETDTRKVKYGDGSTAWNSLPYFTAAPLTLASGLYTPTLTGVTNIDALTANVCQYIRVGDVVTVNGLIGIDVTAAGNFSATISLPVASNIGAVAHVGGTATAATGTGYGRIVGDAATDTAKIDGMCSSTSSVVFAFTFMYRVI